MPRVVHVFTIAWSVEFLRGQVPFMRQRGYEIAAVTAPGHQLHAFGRDESVPVYAVPMSRVIAPGEDAVALRRLVALFREIRPDIVHSHTPKGGLLGTTAAFLARVPKRIYHMRGLPLVTARGVTRALLGVAERTSCSLATDVLCVSPSLRAHAIETGLVSARKARVLASGTGNGVDCMGRFNPDTVPADAIRELRSTLGVGDAPLIGFIGRLVLDKGVIEMAEAWQRLRESHPDAHLVVAGGFEERDAVPEDVRAKLANDERVHLLGHIENMATLYAALDVVAFPSHREGFPNVLLEAASMRVPVVGASAIGTVDAIIDGVTGTLVPLNDAAALAAGVERYLADRALAKRHGAAARERVLREFRPEQVWEALARFYETLAPRSRTTSSHASMRG